MAESNFDAVVANTFKAGATTFTAAIMALLKIVYDAFAGASFDRGVKVARVALAAVDTGGGLFSWANPESGSIIIHRVILDVTTQSSGSCTVDVGTTASSATTSSDNLIDGASIGAAGLLDNVDDTDNGANGKTKQKLATGKWVTASVASGASAGLVGYAYIHYTTI